MKNKFIFDLDDTLISTEYHYTQAKAKAIDYIVFLLGKKTPGVNEIVKTIEDIDRNALKELPNPYCVERYPNSFVKAMKLLCKEKKVKYTNRNIEEMLTIGYSAFETPADDIVPGAAETLDFLLYQQDKLMLLTKGDDSHQMKKAIANGLDRWFDKDSIKIIHADKTPEIILSMAGEHDKERAYMVGNYYRSDIEPAIDAGIKAIYIPNGSWNHELVENSIEKARQTKNVILLESIIEIKDRYFELFG
jgi:putative hydrolase of the HAD superfamily